MQWEFPDRGHGAYRLLRGGERPLVDAWEAACRDPERAQRQRLVRVLEELAPTAFGREHGLSPNMGLQAFRDAVPVRGFDGLWPWMERVQAGEPGVVTRSPVLSLLKTSGTTGAAKLIPVTRPFAEEVRRGQSLWRLGLIRDHEAVTKGKALTVVSPAVEGHLPSGIPYGNNTGRMQDEQPWFVKLRFPVPREIQAIADADTRVYATLRFALQAPITTITTANPSTLLQLCRKLLEFQEPLSRDLRNGTLREGPARGLQLRRRSRIRLRKRPVPADWRPARLWDLATVNCWKGGPASFFLEKLPGALGGHVPVREVGVTASEGYFAVPVSDGDEGGVAWLDGHVLEFIDPAGQARWAWELEQGEQYRLVITTSGGLCRYDLNDIVEVTGFAARAPVLRFVRKGGNVLSITGEKLTEDQVVAAIRSLPEHAAMTGFTAAHRLAEIPCIQLAVEGTLPQAEAVDRALRNANVEYASKRDSGRLGMAEVVSVPPGTYLRYRDARVLKGASPGQVKDLVVAVNAEAWDELMRAR